MPADIAAEIEALIASSFEGVSNATFDVPSIQKDQPIFGTQPVADSKHLDMPDPWAAEISDDPAGGPRTRRVPACNVDWVPLQDPKPAEAESLTVRLQPITGMAELPGTLRFETLVRSADQSSRAEGVLHGTLANVLGPQVAGNGVSSIYALAVRAFMAQDAIWCGGVPDGRPRDAVVVYRAPLHQWADVGERFRGAVRVPAMATDTSDFINVLLTLMLPGGIGALQWAIHGTDAMPAAARVFMPGGASRFLVVEERRATPLAIEVGGACLTQHNLEAFLQRLTRLVGPNAMAHAARTAAHLSRVYRPPDSTNLDPGRVNFRPRAAAPLGPGGVPLPRVLAPAYVALAPHIDPHRHGYGAAFVGRDADDLAHLCGDVIAHVLQLPHGAFAPYGAYREGRIAGNARGGPPAGADGGDGPLHRVSIGINTLHVNEVDAWANLDARLQSRVREARIREGMVQRGHNPHFGAADTSRGAGMRNVFGQIDGLSTLTAPTLEHDGMAAMMVRLCAPASRIGTQSRELRAQHWRRIFTVEAARVHLFTMRALYLSSLVPSRQLGHDGRGLRTALPSKVISATVPVMFDKSSMPFGSLECLEDGAWFRNQDEHAEFVGYSAAGHWETDNDVGAAWPTKDHASRAAVDSALRLSHALGEDVLLGRPTPHAVLVPCSRDGVANPFGYPLEVAVGNGHLRGEVVFGGTGSLVFASGKPPDFVRRNIVAPF